MDHLFEKEPERYETLIQCVGNFTRLLPKKLTTQTSLFEKHNIFPSLVVPFFIESRSMQLFYTGVNIVKNMLRSKP